MSQAHPPHFKFENTLEGVCERVSVVLNDADPARPNRRWSKEFLYATLRDAVCMMAKVAPRHFTKEVNFYLQADKCLQPLPDGCEELRQIVCIVDTRTGEDVTVAEVDEGTSTRNAKYPSTCSQGCDSSLSTLSYTSRIRAAGFFQVTPIPEDDDRYLATALCLDTSDFMKAGGVCTELPDTVCYLITPLVQLMAGLALMNNRDSPNLVAQAQAHFSQFADLLQLSRLQRAEIAALPAVAA